MQIIVCNQIGSTGHWYLFFHSKASRQSLKKRHQCPIKAGAGLFEKARAG